MMKYTEALEYLESLAVFGVRLGLERIEELLRRLKSPETKYKTIHVTGTNGKGSTARFIANSLSACGIKTGLYTSPHLVCYEERMEIDGNPISETEFVTLISLIKTQVDNMIAEGEECPTQFEVLTAVAFLYFAIKKVEYAVIEVGLGGLLDSTNVITPEISVITNVTLEHADKCGGTLEGVAKHKAGIIKENIPVVTGAKCEPLAIIKNVAREKNVKIFVLGEDFFVKFQDDFLELNGATGDFANLKYSLSMKALYQRENSALALFALSLLAKKDFRITKDRVVDAVLNTTHAGRFERVGDIILDGAHNPAGMSALKNTLDALYKDEKRIFLLGVLKDKAVREMISTLITDNDEVIVTKPESDRAMDEKALFLIVKKYSENVVVAKNIEDGISLLQKSEHLKIIAGSLYLIGKVRDLLKLKKC